MSLGGPVSIDWMMKSGGGGFTSWPVLSRYAYVIGKSTWNIINRTSPAKNMNGISNSNGSSAFSYWAFEDGMTLEKLFSPAVEECKCLGF